MPTPYYATLSTQSVRYVLTCVLFCELCVLLTVVAIVNMNVTVATYPKVTYPPKFRAYQAPV